MRIAVVCFLLAFALSGCAGERPAASGLTVEVANGTSRQLAVEITARLAERADEVSDPAWNTTVLVKPHGQSSQAASLGGGDYIFDAWYPGGESAMVRGATDPTRIEGAQARTLHVRAMEADVQLTWA